MKKEIAIVALSAMATLGGLIAADDATNLHQPGAEATASLEAPAAPVPGVAVPEDVAPPDGTDMAVDVTPPKARPDKADPDVVQIAHRRRHTEREAEAAASRAAAEREALADTWAHPLPSAHVSSPYGARAPIETLGMSSSMHSGTDLAAPRGTSIRAAAAGTVTYVGYGHPTKQLTGWVVVITHDNGVETSYNHMDDGGVLVNVGQEVATGEDIARVGSSGNSTGPHLHLSVWRGGAHTDPEPFFADRQAALR